MSEETPVDLMRMRRAIAFLRACARASSPELPPLPQSRLLTRVALAMAERGEDAVRCRTRDSLQRE